MRKYVFHVLFLLLPFSAWAQLADGSFAPDFTLKDLNGQTWHLYELLDQGKNVIIDFSATWCGPCWDYHESGQLNEVYAAYGPQGTNEYMVFLIEGDPDTDEDCLYQTVGCNTQGDWTAGTLYPIINDDHIATAYELKFWPTVFQICPNKLVTVLYHPSPEEIYVTKDECAVATGNNNAFVVDYVSHTGAFCGTITTNPTIKVQNLGLHALESVKAEYYINNVLQGTKLWTGHVVPFASFLFSFDDITITQDALLKVIITEVNGATDDDMTNNVVSTQLTALQAQEQNIFLLELETDLSNTVYWEVANSDSTVLYKGGNPVVIGKADDGGTYTTYDTTYLIPIPLPGDGCYTFSIYDQYGGGLGVKHFEITDPDGVIFAEGGDFEFDEHVLIGVDNAVSPIANNAALSRIQGFPEEFCSHLGYDLTIEILNLGLVADTTAEIELWEKEHVVTVIHWTGSLLPGKTTTISVPPVYFETGQGIRLRIKSINGEADHYEYLNEWNFNLKRNLTHKHIVNLKMQLDHWAHEMYWQLSNSVDGILYSGGNTKVGPNGGGLRIAKPGDPGAYGPEELVNVELVLPDSLSDCYDLLLVDDYGDGFFSTGYIQFHESDDGKVIARHDFFFMPFETTHVLLEVDPTLTSIENNAIYWDIRLYPNPVESELHIAVDDEDLRTFSVSVFNLMGEKCFQSSKLKYESGHNGISVDVSDLAEGIYMVRLESGKHFETQKFSVIR